MKSFQRQAINCFRVCPAAVHTYTYQDELSMRTTSYGAMLRDLHAPITKFSTQRLGLPMHFPSPFIQQILQEPQEKWQLANHSSPHEDLHLTSRILPTTFHTSGKIMEVTLSLIFSAKCPIKGQIQAAVATPTFCYLCSNLRPHSETILDLSTQR